MSKIAIIGATGRAGSQLLQEALRRGHEVTALARHASAQLEQRPGLRVRDIDAADPAALAAVLRGHDAVFSSARFTSFGAPALVQAVKAADVPRLLVVGGAGSLMRDGQRMVDREDMPAAWKPGSLAGVAFLEHLRQEETLDWTFLSPPMHFVDGERTGRYRLGRDELLVAADGSSRISFADFAIAFLDEFEQPAHSRMRFTVGY